MKTFAKYSSSLAVIAAVAFGSVTSTPVQAAPDYEAIEKRKNEKTRVLGERSGKKIQKAFEFYSNDQVNEALEILMDMDPSNTFDRAYVDRMIGNLLAGDENRAKESLSYLEKAVAPDVLNFNEQALTLKLIADLNMQEKSYQKAVDGYLRWMDFTGEQDSNTYVRIANAYYELKQLDKIIEPADQAIALQEKLSADPYVLKLASYYERKIYPKAVDVVETLVKLFPEEGRWWSQLAMFYMLVEDYKKALSAMELAYKQGYLSKENEYKTLSQLYATNDMPFHAAQVQEKYLKQGVIERNKQNVSALANSLLSAMQYKEAAIYYGEAAAFDNDAELYRKQGALFLQAEEYTRAVKALNKALDAGLKAKGKANMSLAQAYFYQRKYKQAFKVIQESIKDPKTAKSAKAWQSYIKEAASRNGVSL